MIKTLYDKFKPWSEGGGIWIISDPHFDDLDCKIMDPDWIDPQTHINILNKKIHKNDTLICLGDVGNLEWIKKIKAKRKVLIMGNHDTAPTKMLEYFSEVYTGPLFISDKILLSHEPIYGLTFCLNIHGHVHRGDAVYYQDHSGAWHMNLASDVTKWQPRNLNDDIIKKGYLSKIDNIHRQTIDFATEHSLKGE